MCRIKAGPGLFFELEQVYADRVVARGKAIGYVRVEDVSLDSSPWDDRT